MVTSVASRPQSCGACVVGGPNVDVYYWPEPNVNTSCLSIIGTALSPPLAGATISNGATYWGYSDEEGYLTTMIYTSINGITFKLPIWDPWPYTETGKLPIGYTYTLMEPLGKRSHETQVRGPIEPRAPFNESQGLLLGNDSFSAGNRMFIESTVVHNGHTLTSPSIYVAFHSLTANDLCGRLGAAPNGVITSTLIAFAPGELSTFGAPLNEWLHGLQPGLTSYILPYDFADLPCPPYESMTNQWYKPEPGEPYRPILAFPSKVLEADPLWKSCSPAFFTGLDPPTALYPATALVPLVTSTADANFKPPKAEPSPTPKNLPENTAKPPAQQVSPAKNTAAPSLGNINPVQKNADSDMQTAVDPSALKAGSNSHNAKDESGSSNGEMIDPLEDETASLATQPTSRAQVAASVGSDDLPEKFTADKGKSSQADPAKSDNSNEENDPSSQSDFAGVGFPNEAANSQQPHAFAAVGGEPIVAVPQQDSPTDNHEIGPGANDGGDHNSSNGSVKDQPDIEISNTPPDPGTSGLQSGYTTASEPYANNDPGVAPVPLTTRIGGYIIQALSSPDAVLVNGESVTRGQDSKVISGTLVALQPNGDLMLGTSTVQVLLPSQLPSYNSFFAVGNQNLAASNNLLDQATYPAQAPQVYRIGTVRITAGGLPMTFAGTKIQAISDGAVIVGSMTYPAFPKPSGAGTESGTGYPAISDPKTRNMTNSSESAEAGGLFGSKSGDVGSNSSASVEAYLGSATIGRASWRLLCAVTVIVMIKQLP